MLNVTTMRRECIPQGTENIPPCKGTRMNAGHFSIVRIIKKSGFRPRVHGHPKKQSTDSRYSTDESWKYRAQVRCIGRGGPLACLILRL